MSNDEQPTVTSARTETPADIPADHPDDRGSSAEREDLLDLLRTHRALFRGTLEGLTDAQAASSPTVSELSLGGLVKHVAATEAGWADFVLHGPAVGADVDWAAVDWQDPPPEVLAHRDGFRMVAGETVAGLLAAYDEVAAATDALVASVDLSQRQPLPAAPWFPAGATWSARRVFAHVVAETAQHAGHADIIRETIDGRKSMG